MTLYIYPIENMTDSNMLSILPNEDKIRPTVPKML